MEVILGSDDHYVMEIIVGLTSEKYKALRDKASDINMTPEEFILKATQEAMDTDMTTNDLADFYYRVAEV